MLFEERDLRSFAAGDIGGGGMIPKQAPPWFASQDEYEAFLKLFAMDRGAQCITATSIEAPHLDEASRKEILGGCALRTTLEFVCSTYAGLDAAALFGRETAFEKRLLAGLQGDLADKTKAAMARGSRLIPPSALNQLIRETIEWSAYGDGEESLRPIELADFTHLLLSINGDQEAQDRPDFFTAWPPTPEEMAGYNDAMTHDDDLVVAELRRSMLSEFARAQTNDTPVPQAILATAYDTWFKGWPDAAAHDRIGDSPAQAFQESTNTPLREVIRMGLHLWGRTKAGDISIDAATLHGVVEPAALDLLKSSAALPVKQYRKRLSKERAQGSLAHRRYTFTERPLIEVSDGQYIVLRPAWVLDRFCGSQLYWQTFAQFGFEKNPAGEQFSLAMNYVFESAVGYLFRRAVRRARATLTLITEDQMQQAWTKAGKTPSVCDWVLVSGDTCVLVDATNVWLDANAAQGLSNPDEYQVELEQTFINKKFEQLKSTRKLLIDNGWEGCTFGEKAVYAPIVVVPNAGIPASVFADIDIKLRTGQLAPNMLAAGVLTYHELEVLEGISQHRGPHLFVELLANWRRQCTGPMPMRLQTYLDMSGFDRPSSSYIGTATRLFLKEAGLPTQEV